MQRVATAQIFSNVNGLCQQPGLATASMRARPSLYRVICAVWLAVAQSGRLYLLPPAVRYRPQEATGRWRGSGLLSLPFIHYG